MFDYKPTFKSSSTHRPLAQRLTPLAWVLIASGALLVALVVAGLVVGLAGCNRDTAWNPTPTATLPATAVPATEVAVASPTPTAEWWAGMVTPTVEAGPPFPAWWSEQMTQDENGAWWPPQEVIQMVGDHYAQRQAEYDAVYLSAAEEGRPPDLDALQAIEMSWTLSPLADGIPDSIEDLRANRVQPIIGTNWQICVPQAQEFSADGLECTLGWVCMNGTYTVYNPLTGETLGDPYSVESSGLSLYRMRYDPTDGRWKPYEFLDWIAGEPQ